MIRIQRKREKGWTMPLNTRYIGRPTLLQNPFIVWPHRGWVATSKAEAKIMYRRALFAGTLEIKGRRITTSTVRKLLRGYSAIACWCGPGDPCHGDIFLEIMNGGE